MYTLQEHLSISQDGTRAVITGTPDAGEVLGTPGQQIEDEVAIKLGLMNSPEPEKPKPTSNKKRKAPANKSVKPNANKDDVLRQGSATTGTADKS